jgi:type IV pilus assembly protein PilC
MKNEDFDFQSLAEGRDLLSPEEFETQEQAVPAPSSAHNKKRDKDGEKRRSKKRAPEQDEDLTDFEFIDAELPEQRKAKDDDADEKTADKKETVKSRKRKVKKKAEQAHEGDTSDDEWAGFESIDDVKPVKKKKSRDRNRDHAPVAETGDDMQYPAPDGSRIVDTYTVVEKAEYEKVDISPEEARGLIPFEALRDMCNEFTRIQSAGVSIRGALRIVKEQAEDEELKEALNRIYERVKMGDDLSEAMNKCKCFPFAFTIAVSAAEKNDMIAPLFGRFGEIFAAEVRNKEHRRVSVFYPMLTTACALVIMFVLCVIVYPAFMDMLGVSGFEPDGISQIVFNAAVTVRRVWWLLLILIILIFFGILAFKLIRENDLFGAKIKEKSLYEDSYERMTVYVKFVRYMNALLKVGVATKDALFVTAHSFYEYPFITDILLAAANAAAGGSTLSNALCVSDFFPMMILQMISVGEEMGDTPGMLDYIAEYYEEEAKKKAIEEQAAKGPVTIAVMAVSVLLLLLMMLLPMLSLFNAVSGLK